MVDSKRFIDWVKKSAADIKGELVGLSWGIDTGTLSS